MVAQVCGMVVVACTNLVGASKRQRTGGATVYVDSVRPLAWRHMVVIATTLACFIACLGNLTSAAEGAPWWVQETSGLKGNATETSMSCSTPVMCTASGNVSGSIERNPSSVTQRWNGEKWSEEPHSPAVTGVSCSTIATCMIVGYKYIVVNGKIKEYVAKAESWNGLEWKQSSLSYPTEGKTRLNGVSCPTSAFCMAVGWISRTSGERPLAERWSGSAWVLDEPPIPSGSTEDFLSGVSCASATSCVAVGSFIGSSGKQMPLAEGWNGSAWVLQEPPALPGSTQDSVSGVSCASATSCVAVGSFMGSSGKQMPLAESWDGISWSAHELSVPSGASNGSLSAVSCRSVTFCVAVGYFVDASGKESPLGEVWNGTSWAVQEPSMPVGGESGSLSGVSCSSSTQCLATGNVTVSAGRVVLVDAYSLGTVVSSTPTGPVPPEGGWSVVFGDGFGRTIGTGSGQDNYWYPNEGACCEATKDKHGNNPDELEMYNASQVRVGAEGLELVDQWSPHRAPAEEISGQKWLERNYVSGALQTYQKYEAGGYHGFIWEPGHGETWAFDCFCRFPSYWQGMDLGWWSTDSAWTNENDFFETWTSGAETEAAGLLGSAWVYHTEPEPREVTTVGYALWTHYSPTAFHHYTTVIKPDNKVEEYIDGTLTGSFKPPRVEHEPKQALILTNALRAAEPGEKDPDPQFQSGSKVWTIKSIAVYEDSNHKGQNLEGGGIAPGTIVE